MDYPQMGLCIAGIAAITPFIWRVLPQREAKGILKDADLDRLDDRMKLYDRLLTVEINQKNQADMTAGLQRDNSLIFGKLDDIKDRLFNEKARGA